VGRVAGIVPKFCACAGHRNRVTPCARRNKEFLARATFCLFNCCTNVVASRTCLAPRREEPSPAFGRNQDFLSPRRQARKEVPARLACFPWRSSRLCESIILLVIKAYASLSESFGNAFQWLRVSNAENGGRKTEDRGRRTEDRGRRTAGISILCDPGVSARNMILWFAVTCAPSERNARIPEKHVVVRIDILLHYGVDSVHQLGDCTFGWELINGAARIRLLSARTANRLRQEPGSRCCDGRRGDQGAATHSELVGGENRGSGRGE
jgi:hypothetical protein